MPNTRLKANYRSKRRSCNMCKPNKTHRADSPTMQQKKADVAYVEQVEAHGDR